MPPVVEQRGEIPLAFTTQNQQTLVEALRRYANEHANVRIFMASMQQKSLADSLKAIFDLAGWQTDIVNEAIELQRRKHYQGVEVQGYNKHLVESATAAMRASGLSGARAVVEQPQVGPDQLTKWNWVQNRLTIIVGHGNV